MQKSEIAPGLIRYLFDPLPGRSFSNSVYALTSDGEALLIDAGWQQEASQIASDLEQNGLKLAGVIISHFHDDHMEGLKILRGVPVYGSAQYQTTLDLWTDRNEQKQYAPSVAVGDKTAIDFGGHTITLIPFPGHSACTMLTIINGEYLHIADEVMFSEEYEPILPGADPGCAKRHFDSLTKLKAYSSYTFLPAHGRPFHGADEIGRQIDKRRCYFGAIIKANGHITYEEAVKDCGGFLQSEWHKHNCCDE